MLSARCMHQEGFLGYIGYCFFAAAIHFCYIIAGDRIWTMYHRNAMVLACSRNTILRGGFRRLLQELPPEMLYLFALLFHLSPQEKHLVLLAWTLHALF